MISHVGRVPDQENRTPLLISSIHGRIMERTEHNAPDRIVAIFFHYINLAESN